MSRSRSSLVKGCSLAANWLLATSLLTFTFNRFSIVITEGASMQPTLNPRGALSKDLILVSKRFGKEHIERGSIVVFDYDETELIGGERQEISGRSSSGEEEEDAAASSSFMADKKFFANKMKGQKFIKRVTHLEGEIVQVKSRVNQTNICIPKDHVWVTGDNSSVSYDSNQIGPISVSSINGIAKLILWPPGRFLKLL
ncbi:MAG: Mitochondrial inner membrane protease subunit 2 [Marteilia pararefringens]